MCLIGLAGCLACQHSQVQRQAQTFVAGSCCVCSVEGHYQERPKSLNFSCVCVMFHLSMRTDAVDSVRSDSDSD